MMHVVDGVLYFNAHDGNKGMELCDLTHRAERPPYLRHQRWFDREFHWKVDEHGRW